MPKTAEPRYTEAEYDEMYGPRLDAIDKRMAELVVRLQKLIEKLPPRVAKER